MFYTHEWAMAVQHAYGAERPILLVRGYEGDALVGLAVLTVEPGGKTAHFLCGTTADYCDFVSRPADSEALVAQTLEELNRSGVEDLVLANLPADSPSVLALQRAAKNQCFHIFSRLAYRCAQVVLGIGEQRAQLKRACEKRKMFRRKMNALQKQAPVVLSHLRSGQDSLAALPAFCDAHVARFLATGRISNLVRSQRREFLAELARRLSESGWFTFTRLMLGEKPIAWNYGFQFSGSWFWYQPTFDSRMEEEWPGYCLLSKMVIEACDEAMIRVVDLGLGDEDYKGRFANAARDTLHISLTSSIIKHVRTAARYRAAEAIRFVPRAEMFARAMAHLAGTLGRRMLKSGSLDFLQWGVRRAVGLVSRRDQVEFYEWERRSVTTHGPTQNELSLHPIDLEALARAAISNEHDAETLSYLQRAAQRLRTPGSQACGFFLTSHEGTSLHLCWVSPFDNFFMDELGVRLVGPSENAAIIFDCWTPQSARGHGYYGVAISGLASRVELEGRRPWIFSGRMNESSIRGIAKAGFVYRYSMERRRTLGFRWFKRLDTSRH